MRAGTASGNTPSDSSKQPLHVAPETTIADARTSGQQSSGVQVNSQCLDSFQELKLGKSASPSPSKPPKKGLLTRSCSRPTETKYIVFKLSADNTQIEVEKTSPSASYDDFLNDLPPNSPRYAVYDFEYEKDGGKRNKICFYAWSPDEAKIKEKMLYASSKDALRRSLVGVANEIQGTDSSEVAYDEGMSSLFSPGSDTRRLRADQDLCAVLDKISRGTS